MSLIPAGPFTLGTCSLFSVKKNQKKARGLSNQMSVCSVILNVQLASRLTMNSISSIHPQVDKGARSTQLGDSQQPGSTLF